MIYWLWLSRRKGLSEAQKLSLAERFPDARSLWAAESYGDFPLKAQAQLSLADKSLEAEEKILARCRAKGYEIITAADPRYPRRLRGISDPPTLLYVQGRFPDFDREAAIGVVGTRRASAYGLMTASKLSAEITAHGGLVVSGMAAGVDSQAARGALQAGGTTVGVLGGGIDHIYPSNNRQLYEDVLRHGCLISEYPPGEKPTKWSFPQRNRIISGLSLGVLVVEAPEKSGTMITVDRARKQGRDLYAVPGRLDSPSCTGSNALLRSAARLVTCGWDVLSEYAQAFPDKLHREPRRAAPEQRADAPAPKAAPIPAPQGTNEQEQVILDALLRGELAVDEIVVRTGLSAQEVTVSLTMLEIRGLVVSLPGRRVKLS